MTCIAGGIAFQIAAPPNSSNPPDGCRPPGAKYERQRGTTHPKGLDHAQFNGRRVLHRRDCACRRPGPRRPLSPHAQYAERVLSRRRDGLADFYGLLRRGALPGWLILACDSVRGSDDRAPVWASLARPSVCCGRWSGPAAGASGWVWWGRTTAATIAVTPRG